MNTKRILLFGPQKFLCKRNSNQPTPTMACSPGIVVLSPSYQPYSRKSASLCAPQAWMTRLAFGNPIGGGGFSHTVSLSSKRIRSWFDTISQFRQTTVQWFTIFCDARYNIFRRESSLVNDGLFFVIFRNWRFRPSMMFVVYMIFRTSAGYAKNVERISQFSSQLLTQLG